MIKIESRLKGKALQIYLHLLKKNEPIGVREIQKNLNFSSPSVAHHHLEKLIDLALVAKDQHGRYYLTQKVDVGVLQAFLKVGRFMLPRYIFYAVFFTSLLFIYFFQFGFFVNLFAIAFGVTASVFFWYETIRVWKRKPF
jgi:hypothetical protein